MQIGGKVLVGREVFVLSQVLVAVTVKNVDVRIDLRLTAVTHELFLDKLRVMLVVYLGVVHLTAMSEDDPTVSH